VADLENELIQKDTFIQQLTEEMNVMSDEA